MFVDVNKVFDTVEIREEGTISKIHKSDKGLQETTIKQEFYSTKGL
jgi:hypothetical protein